MSAEPALIVTDAPAPEVPPPATLLLVDDEPGVLSALRRVFRQDGYRILMAEGGPKALGILATEAVDAIISDMRMPEMTGAEFLAVVAREHPETVRILLTGYSDLSSTVAAINEGRIDQYLAKPWEESNIRLAVRQGLERQHLERERRRLLAENARQNEELRELNATLEQRVRQRTAELEQTATFVEMAYEEAKESFRQSVKVFSNLVEMREGRAKGHSARVAALALALARTMGLDEADQQDVHFAALLHDIGKMGLPDSITEIPVLKLNQSDRRRYEQHTILGAGALMALPAMEGAARIIRSHHEHWDGNGFPDALSGEAIPPGARILAVANDYDNLRTGTATDRTYTVEQAAAVIRQRAGKHYAPQVVIAFGKLLEKLPGANAGTTLPVGRLQEKMRLAADLHDAHGALVLPAGCVLNRALIDKLQRYARDTGTALELQIDPQTVNG